MKKAVFAIAIVLVAALAMYTQAEAGTDSYGYTGMKFSDGINASSQHNLHKFSLHKSHRHNSTERAKQKLTFAGEEQLKEKAESAQPYSVNYADLTSNKPFIAAIPAAVYKDKVNLTILKTRK